jgi:hypothetical protein
MCQNVLFTQLLNSIEYRFASGRRKYDKSALVAGSLRKFLISFWLGLIFKKYIVVVAPWLQQP